ncbi:MAG: hypothetical protein MO852_12695, partial [Candidatus Devosia euplotis]|nr:hypothetical protein [Candidatus Devosia euplotis]
MELETLWLVTLVARKRELSLVHAHLVTPEGVTEGRISLRDTSLAEAVDEAMRQALTLHIRRGVRVYADWAHLPGAILEVDGRIAGAMPLVIRMEPGEHTLGVLEGSGDRVHTETIVVPNDESEVVTFGTAELESLELEPAP